MSSQTISALEGLSEAGFTKEELLLLIDDEAKELRSSGDSLGAGEWVVSSFPYLQPAEILEASCKAIVLWASPTAVPALAGSPQELVDRITDFNRRDLASAVVAVVRHLRSMKKGVPEAFKDLLFRLHEPVCDLFEIARDSRALDAVVQASVTLDGAIRESINAVESFVRATPIAAKQPSILLARSATRLQRMAVSAERPLLGDVEILLSPTFRRLCEASEKNDVDRGIVLAEQVKEQTVRILSSHPRHRNSVLWNLITAAAAKHILALIEDTSRHHRHATTPSLRLASQNYKADLSRLNQPLRISAVLLNQGVGMAAKVVPTFAPVPGLRVVEVTAPSGPFDIDGGSEQRLVLELTLASRCEALDVPVVWQCRTMTGEHRDSDKLQIRQQNAEPDWEGLATNPPYSVNPVRRREELFGRDAILEKLLLHAGSGRSTFLWGQKRVGKTSILQVLALELSERRKVSCVMFRMGELAPLHEGQIAHRIAQRLFEWTGDESNCPAEGHFGAGMGQLIPIVEKLSRAHPGMRPVVIVDEFDDLDSAFYTGQRGKQFIKALRSLSEAGLTFFFVGSERMRTIYGSHEADLNKWVDVLLDRIDSREDCRALLTRPVSGVIEFDSQAVDKIIDLCDGNPFFMRLMGFEVFEQCYQERRTFVGMADVQHALPRLIQKLGPTNVAHFWEDNPVIEERDRVEQRGENALVLSCVAKLGGAGVLQQEAHEIQEALSLTAAERMSKALFATTVERLLARRVLRRDEGTNKVSIRLPILREWLSVHADSHVLTHWREWCEFVKSEGNKSAEIAPIQSNQDSSFPVDEDALLAIAQQLVFQGRQKDVSEIRVWLRQFDDDVRIEIAFLLLQRLAEKGFVSDGARLH